MNDRINEQKMARGLSNLIMVKAFSTIHAATGASVETISVAVEYSIARDLGMCRKSLDSLVQSAREDPKLIETILRNFGTELLDIRREDIRSLQAELGGDLVKMAKKPPATHTRRVRRGKHQLG